MPPCGSRPLETPVQVTRRFPELQIARNEPISHAQTSYWGKVFWRLGMSPLLLACIAVAAPVAGMGLMQLQTRLERWDYERHAED